MTDVRSNLWGKYSENDVRKLREENRIMEMRWEVFEGLYDKIRQELEKLQITFGESIRLKQDCMVLETEKNDLVDMINQRDQEIESSHELILERSVENAKLHDEIYRLQDELFQLKNPNAVREDLPLTEEEVNDYF